MIKLNKLYACLVYGAQIADTDYYKKAFTPVTITQRVSQLLTVLRSKINREDYPKFACILLYVLMQTTKADKIEELDPQNTYKNIKLDRLYPFYALLPSKQDLKKHAYKLDEDLQQEIKGTTDLYEQIAIYCIQIVRSL